MCQLQIAKLTIYGISLVTTLGMVFNVLGILAIAQILRIKKPKSNMFRYFLVVNLADMLNNMLVCVGSIATWACLSCLYVTTPGGQLYFKLLSYLPASFSDIVALMQLAATVDCYLSMVKQYKMCQSRVLFYVLAAISTVYALVIESNMFFKYDFIQKNVTDVQNSTLNQSQIVTITSIEYSTYGASLAAKFLLYSTSIIRDAICLVILIVLNVLIYVKIRRALVDYVSRSGRAKVEVDCIRRSSVNSNNTSLLRILTALKAEKKRAIVVLFTGINYLVGHAAMVVFLFAGMDGLWICLIYLSIFVLYLSKLSSFFVFYLSSRVFRKCVNNMAVWLFCCNKIRRPNTIAVLEALWSHQPGKIFT